VNPLLTITSAYTNMKVVNLTGGVDGSQFSFMGGQQLLNFGINPALVYGSVIGQLVPYTGSEPRKAGIPQQVYGLNFLGSADPWVAGLSGTVALQHVSSCRQASRRRDFTQVHLGESGCTLRARQMGAEYGVQELHRSALLPLEFPRSVRLERGVAGVARNYSATLQYKF